MAMAYTIHLGSDKNKKASSKQMAKSNASGTTSLSNNAIQNVKTLSKCENHNYRKYDNEQEKIVIVRGSDQLVNDVKNLYHQEFDEAQKEYNSWQLRKDRMIDDYFKHISDDKAHDLACELVIELGDKEFWDTKDDDYKKRMESVYKKQVDDLELLMPNFKVSSAVIHFDETSPHMHVIGIPIIENCKRGMEKQVGKSKVFTKTSLANLQDKMRTLCIAEFNEEYNLKETLKTKQKGRNQDINVKDMGNYIELKKEIENQKVEFKNTTREYKELKEIATNVKNDLTDIKPKMFGNDYTLTKEQKDKIENLIDKVDKTSESFNKVNNIVNTLNNVKDDLDNIKYLKENNKALNLKVKTLEKTIDSKDEYIEDLKKENFSLKTALNKIKEKFKRLFNFLVDKMFDRNRETYWEVSKDLYEHGIIDTNEIYTIKDKRDWNIEEDKHHSRDNDLER